MVFVPFYSLMCTASVSQVLVFMCKYNSVGTSTGMVVDTYHIYVL